MFNEHDIPTNKYIKLYDFKPGNISQNAMLLINFVTSHMSLCYDRN